MSLEDLAAWFQKSVYYVTYKTNNVYSVSIDWLILYNVLLIPIIILLTILQRFFTEKVQRILYIINSIFYLIYAVCLNIFLSFILVLPHYGSFWYGFILNTILMFLLIIPVFRTENRKGYQQIQDEDEKSSVLSYVKTSISNWVNEVFKGVKVRKWYIIFSFIVILVVSLLFNGMTCGLCVAYFPHKVSTLFSRTLTTKDCKWNTICNYYLTVPEDIRTQMIVNYHFYGDLGNATYVKIRNRLGVERKFESQCFRIDDLEQKRKICWADIYNLTPNSTYHATAVIQKGSEFITSKEIKFKTGPSSFYDSFTFLSGGDLSWKEPAIELLKEGAKREPLFAIVGGDIAYDNGDINCYLIWDQWFSNWDKYMTTPSNYTIPILTAVGNHEGGGFRLARSYNSFYIRYFPHQTGLYQTDPQERDLHHYHRFSYHSDMIVLDSWVHEDPEDQVEWINQTLSFTQVRSRFAVYHSSAYPYRDMFSGDVEKFITPKLQKYWVPLFDHFQLSAAFENHYHAYKKTYPLRGGEIYPTGTLYLGDGCLGVPTTSYKFSNNSLIEEHQKVSHLYIVTPELFLTTYEVIYFENGVKSKPKFFN